MTPSETVAATKAVVTAHGGAFMLADATRSRAAEAGLSGWRWYYAGRCGVLGPAPAEVVVAAMVFFPPELVVRTWGKVTGSSAPALDGVVARYADCAAEWGRQHLGEVDGLEGWLGAAEALVDSADVAGLPLFAGWRSVTRPDDLPGRAGLVLHLLREHRGGLHGLAVLASGMTPLEAIVSGPLGVPNAEFFGWPEPFPEVGALVARRAEVEAHTDRLVAAHHDRLGAAELQALVDGCARIGAAVSP